MAIDADILLPQIKTDLKVDGDASDGQLRLLIDEAVYTLQQFKAKTLVTEVADAATETTLTPLDLRYIKTYVRLQYDGSDLQEALNYVLELVRDRV